MNFKYRLKNLCWLFILFLLPLDMEAQTDSLYTADQIPYFILKAGSGPQVELGQEVEFHIEVTSIHGDVLFSTRSMGVTNFEVLGSDPSPAARIQDNAFRSMKPGGLYRFFVPKSKLQNPQVAQLPGQHVIYNIELIHAGSPQPSAADHLEQIIREKGLEAAALELQVIRGENPGGYVLRESELNILGYQLLDADKQPEAVAIFQMIVELFPNSFNAYDSLGDAYLAIGQSDKARAAYEQSLQLNPENTYTKEKIEKL